MVIDDEDPDWRNSSSFGCIGSNHLHLDLFARRG